MPTKGKIKIVDLELQCRGMKYRLSDPELLQLEEIVNQEGFLACRFEKEPDNEVDQYAIKVIGLDPEKKRFTNRHLGYIARPTNKVLWQSLSAGATVKECRMIFVDSTSGEAELAVKVRV